MQNSCLEVLLIFPHTTGCSSAGATISKTLTFEVPKFSQSFLFPFRFRWVLTAGLGHGAAASRGFTSLHQAASNGHDGVVQRLLEAKAAVDAKNEDGRGLGRRIWGEKNLLRQWESLLEEVDEMLIRFKVLFHFCFHFLWKVSVKTCASRLCFCFFVVTIFHDCVLCPPPVALFCGPTLGSDFAPEFGECPL